MLYAVYFSLEKCLWLWRPWFFWNIYPKNLSLWFFSGEKSMASIGAHKLHRPLKLSIKMVSKAGKNISIKCIWVQKQFMAIENVFFFYITPMVGFWRKICVALEIITFVRIFLWASFNIIFNIFKWQAEYIPIIILRFFWSKAKVLVVYLKKNWDIPNIMAVNFIGKICGALPKL